MKRTFFLATLLSLLTTGLLPFSANAEATALINTSYLKMATAKVVIRKISGKDGQVTEVCRKTLKIPIFIITKNMPASPMAFVPVKCETKMGEQALTVTLTPSALEGSIPADSKDLMLADLGGAYVKYFGGILTVEPSALKTMSALEQKNSLMFLQAPVMNGSSLLGTAPAKAFVTLAPIPNNCSSDGTKICENTDQFTATLLIDDNEVTPKN